VQNKKDNPDKRLSFLCCTGAVLFIQIVFFMLHWCCFVYPGCLFMLHWCCLIYPGYLDKTAPVQHKKEILDRQNSTSAK
jgi:hypothetical protein